MWSCIHLQGEMQQLREKLAVAERTAKAEAQMKVRKINFCNLLSVVCALSNYLQILLHLLIGNLGKISIALQGFGGKA